MPKDFLFELGVEEIPARFMAPLLEQLRQLAAGQLAAAGLAYASLRVLATPRRLTLLIGELAEQSADTLTEVKGPALKAAYDEQHQPTRALLGFCNSQHVSPEQLQQREVNGNPYLFAEKRTAGRPARELLPTLLPAILDKLSFAKPMRWGANPVRFVRPVRWLVALYGGEVVALAYAGVQADRFSRGHRFLGGERIEINDVAEYLPKLKANYVIVDQEERRSLIEEQVLATAREIGGCLHAYEELLDEVTYLLEYPTALAGRFEEKYLALPEELVTTPMVDQQRYFPVYSNEGRLLPHFITVRNGDAYDLQVVAEGNESVLRSRLADAEFFYHEDLRSPLEAKVEKLSDVVFHEKMGSMRLKIDRIVELAAFLGRALGYTEEEMRQVRRAAYLCKADLASHVVYEFPELQGIIGEYYAVAQGEEQAVAQAIREHYLPRFAGDAPPQTKAGLAVALADKLDNLAAFFAIGQAPSGSQDPYALRRAAQGCVQIIIHHKLSLSLREALPFALKLLAAELPDLQAADAQERLEQLVLFFQQRLENLLAEEGVGYDIINALNKVGTREADLLATLDRAKAVREFRATPEFHCLLAGFHRAANILKSGAGTAGPDAERPQVAESLFKDKSERELYQAVLQAEAEAGPLVEAKDYRGALAVAGRLTAYIDAFFEAVMVMDQDEAVRRNRLALLQRIVQVTDGVAELSQIVEA